MKIPPISKRKKKIGSKEIGRHKKITKKKKFSERKKIRKRKEVSITIPKVMWTAGCCIGSDPKSGKKKVESIAVIGHNLPKNTLTTATTVLQLQLWLANRHGPVELFPGQSACSKPRNRYNLKV